MLVMTQSPRKERRAAARKADGAERRHEAGPRARSAPMRTCAGCRAVAVQDELVRFVLGPDQAVVADVSRRLPGRGAWVHPRITCLESAAQKGFSRTFRASILVASEALLASLRQAADRRVGGLLSAAWRSHKAAIGATAVKEAIENGGARLVVVACDARAALSTPGVESAIAEGHAVAWGNKSKIGDAVRRTEVGVLAVLDIGLAQALSSMISIAHLGDARSEIDRAGGYPFREV